MLTQTARDVLEEILEEVDQDFLALVEEYANEGICHHCGNLQSGVEPDAERYTCQECGQPAVGGIELALMELDV